MNPSIRNLSNEALYVNNSPQTGIIKIKQYITEAISIVIKSEPAKNYGFALSRFAWTDLFLNSHALGIRK